MQTNGHRSSFCCIVHLHFCVHVAGYIQHIPHLSDAHALPFCFLPQDADARAGLLGLSDKIELIAHLHDRVGRHDQATAFAGASASTSRLATPAAGTPSDATEDHVANAVAGAGAAVAALAGQSGQWLCSRCGCLETGQRRRGPAGGATLCNACGVHWMLRTGWATNCK